MALTPSAACFISAFAPRNPFLTSPATTVRPPTCPSPRSPLPLPPPRMVAPKHVRRTEEIQRLTKQLEELRQMREQLKSSSNSPSQSPSPSAPAPAPTPPVTVPSAPLSPLTSPSPPSSSIQSTFHPGKHSENSRFLSISSVDSEEFHPRILLIAGTVPALSVSDFLNVPQILYSKEPAKGNFFISRLPDGYTGDFVSMQTVDSLAKCGDPIALLIDPAVLSASKLPITHGDDVILVVDRAAATDPFKARDFYAWDVNGTVQIGWSEYEPPADTAKRIGKVVYGHIEIESQLREKKSCWEEENEIYT